MTNRDKNEINQTLLAMAFIDAFPLLTGIIMLGWYLAILAGSLTILWVSFSTLLSLF